MELTGDFAQTQEAHYKVGDPVWVGRSMGSMRKGTIVRYLGEGSYAVVTERGTRPVVDGLISPRREDK
jgi:hypothetical protein